MEKPHPNAQLVEARSIWFPYPVTGYYWQWTGSTTDYQTN